MSSLDRTGAPDVLSIEMAARHGAYGHGERWYHDLLQALPVAIYTTDADGVITFFNSAAAELAGRTPVVGHDKWCVTWKLYNPDGSPLPHDACPMAIALKEDRPVRGAEAILERPDGTRIPMKPYPTPLHDEDGHLIGAVNMLIDISAERKAEADRKTMVNELNHRVKNTLSAVQGFAAHSIRAGNANMRTEFDARLMALARAHDQLTDALWSSADLRQILSNTLLPYGSERVRLEGDAVNLPPKMALVLAMAFHELAANAAKHGALSGTNGRLDVSWQMSDQLIIDWNETGGPDVAQPVQTGFGVRLLSRGIVDELGGKVELHFDGSGLHCRVQVPLSRTVA